MDPQDALNAAIARAHQMRRSGAYGDALDGDDFALDVPDQVSAEDLLEWAVVEPDPDNVYSTRRYGAPITATKQFLIRALRQYHGQMLSQQTRFNIMAAVYVAELSDRIAELERRLAEREPPPPSV